MENYIDEWVVFTEDDIGECLNDEEPIERTIGELVDLITRGHPVPRGGKICGLSIVNVIFNPPATIVFWSDGTKTVVKAQGKGKKQEKYDAEKGLAMAIVKRIMGNTGKYNELFKTWITPWEK